ncbi:hypothetical protein TeGR_g6041 [Tetraparma gracilis]|uniref:Uncharacterized protein n=1 Tax=Tetraparma gracilis TaxID=2962635 RepID=A0ABQ6MLD7_9STRA|nr:hypothetical protein TeGR_g6041 [Tetraparma gracilis]
MLSAALLLAVPSLASGTTILAFGDSQGDIGPTYKIILGHAARSKFGSAGADYVDAEANACLKAASDRAMACTETMLGKLWEEFPDTKVGMYNYEVPDMAGSCLDGDRRCMVKLLACFQTVYVDALAANFSTDAFTGMDVLGACQKASGVPGAEAGSPAFAAGTKSEWMTDGLRTRI